MIGGGGETPGDGRNVTVNDGTSDEFSGPSDSELMQVNMPTLDRVLEDPPRPNQGNSPQQSPVTTMMNPYITPPRTLNREPQSTDRGAERPILGHSFAGPYTTPERGVERQQRSVDPGPNSSSRAAPAVITFPPYACSVGTDRAGQRWRTVRWAKYSTMCKHCGSWIQKGDGLECFSFYGPGKRTAETYWSHPYEMCLTPRLPLSAEQMSTPLNGISIIDSLTTEFSPRQSGDYTSHFNSAPQAATTPLTNSITPRSVGSAPPNFPEFVSVPRIGENNESAVPSLQPRSTTFQGSRSVRSERSELTDFPEHAVTRTNAGTITPNQSARSKACAAAIAANVSDRTIMFCVNNNRHWGLTLLNESQDKKALIEQNRKASLQRKQESIEKAVQEAEMFVRNRAFSSPDARLVEAAAHISSSGYTEATVREAVEVLSRRMIDNSEFSDEEVRIQSV